MESYGKAALVGLAGEQEHAVACITSPFGDALRQAMGGGRAWVSSFTKRCAAGEAVDVPLAYKDEIWVRSHYDGITVRVPDAPGHGEIVVIAAVASGGRMHERLGGMTARRGAHRVSRLAIRNLAGLVTGRLGEAASGAARDARRGRAHRRDRAGRRRRGPPTPSSTPEARPRCRA